MLWQPTSHHAAHKCMHTLSFSLLICSLASPTLVPWPHPENPPGAQCFPVNERKSHQREPMNKRTAQDEQKEAASTPWSWETK